MKITKAVVNDFASNIRLRKKHSLQLAAKDETN